MKFTQKEIEYLKRLVINEINREAQLEGRAVVWRIDLKRKPEDMSNDVYNKLSELIGNNSLSAVGVAFGIDRIMDMFT